MRTVHLPVDPRTFFTSVLAALVLAACGGDDGGGDGPIDPPPDEPEEFTLTVDVTGDGSGTVTSSPEGIDCSTTDGSCSADFEEGTSVTLTAQAEGDDDEFDGWSGACSGTGSCAVTLNADASVGAEFDDVTLTTETVGSEGGTVGSSDGSLELTFPAGALGSDQEITIRRLDPADLTGELATIRDNLGITHAYDLGPDGATFDEPVEIRIETGASAVVEGSTVSTGLLVHTKDGVTGLPASQVIDVGDDDEVTVTGTLTSFSNAAVVDNTALRWRVRPEQTLVVNQPGNFTFSMEAGPALVGPVISPEGSATYGDRDSQNPVAEFDDVVDLSYMTDPGNLWSSTGRYTCGAAGDGRIFYGFDYANPDGQSVLFQSQRGVTCEQQPPELLEIIPRGDWLGSVEIDPGGIVCDGTSSCSAELPVGTEVTVTAFPRPGNWFCGYRDGTGNELFTEENQFVFLFDGARTLEACFAPFQSATLDLAVSDLPAEDRVVAPGIYDVSFRGDGSFSATGRFNVSSTMFVDPSRGVFGLPAGTRVYFNSSEIQFTGVQPRGNVQLVLEGRDNPGPVNFFFLTYTNRGRLLNEELLDFGNQAKITNRTQDVRVMEFGHTTGGSFLDLLMSLRIFFEGIIP